MDRKRRDFLKTALAAGAGVVLRGAIDALEAGGLTGIPSATATESLNELFFGLSPYWGDLHAHTGYSDGFGTPGPFYDFGRIERDLDFCAVTDHSEWIRFFQDRLLMEDGTPVPLWANLVAELDAQYLPGSFVTFPGYEWTSDSHGHRTVVFGGTDSLPDAPPSTINHPTPEELWTALEPYPAMTIPHHVTRWGTLVDWNRYNPVTDRLVEIYSKWGNGASAFTSYEPPTKYIQFPFLRSRASASGVDAMLARGHRIGIIAASDSHQGHPGSTEPDARRGTILPPDQYPTTGEAFLDALEQGFTFDHREPEGGGGGLSAVWASELTRPAIWDSLYQRRTLGTTGVRPTVMFGVRDSAEPSLGATMGGELEVTGAPVLLVSAVPEPGSTVSRIVLLETNDPLLTVPSPEPGVATALVHTALPVGESACYRAMVFIRQDADANLDGDTILEYDRESNRFFQSSDPQRDEQVWTSPVWVTRLPS